MFRRLSRCFIGKTYIDIKILRFCQGRNRPKPYIGETYNTMIYMSNFELMGKNLIALRKRKGITQTQLANLVNETSYRPDIKQSRISDLERLNGEELPSIPLLAALSEVLETNPGYILGLTENDRPSKGWDNEIPLSVQSEEEKALFHELFELLRKKPLEEQRLILDMVRLTVPKAPRIIGGKE